MKAMKIYVYPKLGKYSVSDSYQTVVKLKTDILNLPVCKPSI